MEKKIFLSGTSANMLHFHAYLMEALTQWNENRWRDNTADDLSPYLHAVPYPLVADMMQLETAVYKGSMQHPSKSIVAPRKYTGKIKFLVMSNNNYFPSMFKTGTNQNAINNYCI